MARNPRQNQPKTGHAARNSLDAKPDQVMTDVVMLSYAKIFHYNVFYVLKLCNIMWCLYVSEGDVCLIT